MLHLQTFRHTFTGPQAVAWLTSSAGGGAGSCEEAVDLAGRMQRAGESCAGPGWKRGPARGGGQAGGGFGRQRGQAGGGC
jgi:hypothetical protein